MVIHDPPPASEPAVPSLEAVRRVIQQLEELARRLEILTEQARANYARLKWTIRQARAATLPERRHQFISVPFERRVCDTP